MYQKNKNKVRDEAINWYSYMHNYRVYLSEVVEKQEYFYKKGKRYGLLREFRENGIC